MEFVNLGIKHETNMLASLLPHPSLFLLCGSALSCPTLLNSPVAMLVTAFWSYRHSQNCFPSATSLTEITGGPELQFKGKMNSLYTVSALSAC